MFEKIIMNKLNTILKIWNYFQGFSNSAGKYIPSSNPCYTVVAWFFPIYSWESSQLCFPCNCWYVSQVKPGHCPRFSLGIFPSFL